MGRNTSILVAPPPTGRKPREGGPWTVSCHSDGSFTLRDGQGVPQLRADDAIHLAFQSAQLVFDKQRIRGQRNVLRTLLAELAAWFEVVAAGHCECAPDAPGRCLACVAATWYAACKAALPIPKGQNGRMSHP